MSSQRREKTDRSSIIQSPDKEQSFERKQAVLPPLGSSTGTDWYQTQAKPGLMFITTAERRDEVNTAAVATISHKLRDSHNHVHLVTGKTTGNFAVYVILQWDMFVFIVVIVHFILGLSIINSYFQRNYTRNLQSWQMLRLILREVMPQPTRWKFKF